MRWTGAGVDLRTEKAVLDVPGPVRIPTRSGRYEVWLDPMVVQ